MIREKMIEKDIGHRGEFRWRGHEITRIEGLSDAIFAFAITRLVVSLAGDSKGYKEASGHVQVWSYNFEVESYGIRQLKLVL